MEQILHYPRLDTILNVEEVIKKSESPLSKNEIDRRLKKKIMRPTLNIILDYLEESGKIEKEVKGILWIRQKEINNELRKRLNEDELIKMKTKIIKILKKNDVVKAGIFGSYARGEAKKDSDIDILIKFKGSKSLFDLVRVERELKEALNVDVDLITYNSINPHLKESILRDEVKII